LKGLSPAIEDGTRPGKNMKSVDFEVEALLLSEGNGVRFYKSYDSSFDKISDYMGHNGVISHSLYPEVHSEYRQFLGKYRGMTLVSKATLAHKLKPRHSCGETGV
jgi:pyruvate carboxylase